VAFLCDVYHHLENHERILASIHKALRPRGLLVLVEFDRVEGKGSTFVLNHIRASQTEFRREIEEAGFKPRPISQAPRLKENFIAKFQKTEKAGAKEKINGVRSGGHD
jgi:SAM-dependent methyltransferase